VTINNQVHSYVLHVNLSVSNWLLNCGPLFIVLYMLR